MRILGMVEWVWVIWMILDGFATYGHIQAWLTMNVDDAHVVFITTAVIGYMSHFIIRVVIVTAVAVMLILARKAVAKK